MAYLTSAFDMLCTLNTSLQGKGSNVFSPVSKIDAFKAKIDCWINKISNNHFSFSF